MSSKSYWDNRAIKLEKFFYKRTNQTLKRISGYFDNAQIDVEKRITEVFENFVRGGKITKAEAKELLNNKDTREVRKELQQQLKRSTNPEERKRLLNRLNAPAYQSRITRLQAVKDKIALDMYQAGVKTESSMTERFSDTLKEAESHTVFNAQQEKGKAFKYNPMSDKRLQTVLNNKWSNKHYSERLWGHIDDYADKIGEVISTGIASGMGNNKMVENLMLLTGQTKANVTRLVRTENNYFSNQGILGGYRKAGITGYVYIATLDLKTSETCQNLDNKVFSVKKARAGINLPPMHPYCRSTTRPYRKNDTGTRAAIDPKNKKRIFIPQDMSYVDWYNKYVKTGVLSDKKQLLQNEEIKITEKQVKNKYSVARNFVNSKKFTDKFFELPISKNTANSAYKESKKILEQRDGTEYESVSAIDYKTGEHIVSNGTYDVPFKSAMTKEEYSKIDNYNGEILLIHNHAQGTRLSKADIFTAFAQLNVTASMAVGHDGSIHYIYDFNRDIDIDKIYQEVYNKYISMYGNKELANIKATDMLYRIKAFKYLVK